MPPHIAYTLGSYNTARHFRIDHLVGSLAPGRYADVVLLSDPERVTIDRVYADGLLVSENYKPVVPVPKIDWPEWATKTVDLGATISASDFVVAAPNGRTTVTAAILSPFYHEPNFMTERSASQRGSGRARRRQERLPKWRSLTVIPEKSESPGCSGKMWA